MKNSNNLINFKTLVKNKVTKEVSFITLKAKSKSEAVKILRGSGYMVNPEKVKEESLYNWILDNTSCQPDDWKLKEIPV